MDNQKTGDLIKKLRKEKGLTQKDLASSLNITDRAVSKWERGLCAPDISLLEPLCHILGCSISELISGGAEESTDGIPSLPGSEKELLDYSLREIDRKVSIAKRKYTAVIVSALILALSVVLFILWQGNYFHIIEKSPSPDGLKTAVIYDVSINSGLFSKDEAISVITDLGGDSQWRTVYGDCEFKGLWWAPDSRKYVLMLEYPDGPRLSLSWLERNSQSNLNAYLTMGVEASELSQYGYIVEDGWPNIDYQFLQWAADSQSMLIYYSFEDRAGKVHSGYFWYNCLDCTVNAVLEMDA